MSRGLRIAMSACAAAVLIAASASWAAEQTSPKANEMPPEMAEMLKLAQPGEHHAHLAKMVGTWKAHSKMWMAPGAPPEEGDGTMVVRPILDGRFFVSEFKGVVMGQPFQGFGMDGYDNFKGKHVSTWADSMGTMVMMFEGTCSQGGKVTEMRADYVDPMTKQPGYMRSLTTVKDPNTVVMEGFGPGPDGKEVKMMEITYTRN